MKTHELEVEQHFRLGLEETFAFFEDPANLAKITPPSLSFEIKSQNVVMEKGAEIDYTIHWMGLPMRWKTLIEEYEPPVRFVDVQARGPYALWHHTHTFAPVENGTLVTDRVRYRLPMGPLGEIAHKLAVGNQLREIFAYRQEKLAELLGPAAMQPEPAIRAAGKEDALLR